MSISKRLKAWRKRGGFSQEAAARIFLVTASAYQKWELGAREPQGSERERIDTVLERSEVT